MATEAIIEWGVRYSDGFVYICGSEQEAKERARPNEHAAQAKGEVVCRFIRTERTPWGTLADHFPRSVRPSE